MPSKPALPNPARAAPSSDRASSSPFDSLIDDGTQAARLTALAIAAGARRQRPRRNRIRPLSQPAKAKGTKAAQAKGDTKVANAAIAPDAADAANATDAGNAAETDITVTNSKVPSDGKVKADTKLFEPAKAGDNSKPASDDKPADGTRPSHTGGRSFDWRCSADRACRYRSNCRRTRPCHGYPGCTRRKSAGCTCCACAGCARCACANSGRCPARACCRRNTQNQSNRSCKPATRFR